MRARKKNSVGCKPRHICLGYLLLGYFGGGSRANDVNKVLAEYPWNFGGGIRGMAIDKESHTANQERLHKVSRLTH